MMLPMTIRRAPSRVQHIANVAPLRAAVLGAILCGPAAAQDKGQEVYPAPPPGPPPVSKVEGSEATDEAIAIERAAKVAERDAAIKLILAKKSRTLRAALGLAPNSKRAEVAKRGRQLLRLGSVRKRGCLCFDQRHGRHERRAVRWHQVRQGL